MYNNNKNGLEGYNRDTANSGNIASLDKYKGELSELDLTDAQAEELLQTLFNTIRMIVEMGFEYDLCGQVFGEADQLPSPSDGDVDSKHSANAKGLSRQEEDAP